MVALFVQQLTTLDFSFLSHERGLVGETWLVDITLFGDLDDQGMVFDFGHVKKRIKSTIDQIMDHCLVVPIKHPDVDFFRFGDEFHITLKPDLAKHYVFCKVPSGAVFLVDEEMISEEVVTPILEKKLMQELPKNISGIKLKLYPEKIEESYYQYSHGLRKHQGDCQRIAHGHRSKIEIFVDGEKKLQLQKDWANRWRDIYIANPADILSEFVMNGVACVCFGYTSSQGRFELSLAKSSCYFIDKDTTVEHLAEHIALVLSKEIGSSVRVQAYEGYNKGAISEN